MMMAHHDDVDGTEERKHSCWQQAAGACDT